MTGKRREKIVRVLLTEPEKVELQRAADDIGIAVAAFTRFAALEKARSVRPRQGELGLDRAADERVSSPLAASNSI